MDNRDMELFAGIMRERQQELRNEMEMQAIFNNGLAPSGVKRRVLLSLAATIVIVTVAILAGAQFLA
jgi:hypothetical protein